MASSQTGLATKKLQNAKMSESLDWEYEDIGSTPDSAADACDLDSMIRNDSSKSYESCGATLPGEHRVLKFLQF